MLASLTAKAQNYPRGDVDCDGVVNISDVTCLIDNLLKGVAYGDVDQDGAVNISDVTCLIDYLLQGTWPDEPVTPPDDHDWVDLGLPSGTIWATRNVGASSPEDYGDYFAWGEIEPKYYYDWGTYKWYQEGYFDANNNWHHGGHTKYSTISIFGYDGFVDNKTELDPSDDAACANYPGGRMPSSEQIQELCKSCSWQWTQQGGVKGMLVTGSNGNTMFLPATGTRNGNSISDDAYNGYYWSRTLYSGGRNDAYYLSFNWRGWGLVDQHFRIEGCPVRAVRVSK